MSYPSWSYFPRNIRPPAWVGNVVSIVAGERDAISTESRQGPDSDAILARLSVSLRSIGFDVELSKASADKIRRPVLYGTDGREEVAYEVDAWHEELGIAVEVEAGRGSQNNADYRDIVRASLLLDANFLVLLMPLRYSPPSLAKSPIRAYQNSMHLLSAIYASQRLRLPFEGVLLIGY